MNSKLVFDCISNPNLSIGFQEKASSMSDKAGNMLQSAKESVQGVRLFALPLRLIFKLIGDHGLVDYEDGNYY